MAEEVLVQQRFMWGKEVHDKIEGELVIENTKEGREKALAHFDFRLSDLYQPEKFINGEEDDIFKANDGDWDEPTGIFLNIVHNEVEKPSKKVGWSQKEKISSLRSQTIKLLSELEFEVESMRKQDKITADQYVENIERFQDAKAKISFACDDITLN